MLPGNSGELQCLLIWDKHGTPFVLTASSLLLFPPISYHCHGLFMKTKKKRNQFQSRLGHTNTPISLDKSQLPSSLSILSFRSKSYGLGKALSDTSSAFALALDPNASDCVPMYAVDVSARLLRQVDNSKGGDLLSCADAQTAVHTQEHTDTDKGTGAAAVSLVPVT